MRKHLAWLPGAVLVTCMGGSVSAQSVAWVVANQPSAARYTPTVAFHSAGGVASIVRERAGVYNVEFSAGIGRGPIHVAAFGGTNRCTTAQLGGTNWFKVHCFNTYDTSVDAPFVALSYGEQAGSSAGGGAYLWYAGGTGTNVQWNSAGGSTAVRRVAVGEYEISFGNQPPGPTGLIITAWTPVSADGGPAPGAARHCVPAPLMLSGTGYRATVRCYSTPGRLADSWFVASLFRDPFVGSRHDGLRQGGLNSAVARLNSTGQPVLHRRLSTGTYETTFQGLSVGWPFVAAASTHRCILNGTSQPLVYRCFAETGVLSDAAATVLFLTSAPHPWVDLAAQQINFRMVRQRGQERATIEVEGVVRNLGPRAFASLGTQTIARLYQGSAVIATVPVATLAGGGTVSVTHQIEWNRSLTPVPSFRLEIVHSPTILLDPSFDNDDRNPRNNVVSRAGTDINALFR